MSGFGELPERERRFPGVGFSTGKPQSTAKPPVSAEYIDGYTRIEVVGTTAKVVVTRNIRRAILQLQNRGAGTIYLSFSNSPGDYLGTAPAVAIELPSGGFYELPPTNGMVICSDLYAVASSADNNLIVTEGLRIIP